MTTSSMNSNAKQSSPTQTAPLTIPKPTTPSSQLPTPTHPSQPKGSSEEEAEAADQQGSKNEYISCLNKRLRTLKKRLQKIERYEVESSTRSLNPDQLSSIQKKPEVTSLIALLEDLSDNFQRVDLAQQQQETEQRAVEAAKAKERELQEAQALKAALQEMKAAQKKASVTPLHVCHWLCRIECLDLQGTVLECAMFLRDAVLGAGSADEQCRLTGKAIEVLGKLVEASDDKINAEVFGFTFRFFYNAIHDFYFVGAKVADSGSSAVVKEQEKAFTKAGAVPKKGKHQQNSSVKDFKPKQAQSLCE